MNIHSKGVIYATTNLIYILLVSAKSLLGHVLGSTFFCCPFEDGKCNKILIAFLERAPRSFWIPNFKVRWLFEGGALSTEYNRILRFFLRAKRRLFMTDFN